MQLRRRLVRALERRLKGRSWLLQAALYLVGVITAGLYTGKLAADPDFWRIATEENPVAALATAGWVNLILLVLIIATTVQFYLARRVDPPLRPADASEAIKYVLRAGVRALVFPHSWEDWPVRAFCHRYRQSPVNALEPIASAGYHNHDDERICIPIDSETREVFVVVQAFEQRRLRFRDLTIERLPVEELYTVWRLIRSVLAVPVLDEQGSVVGTVSFDSSFPSAIVGLDKEDAHDIAVLIAKAIAQIWEAERLYRMDS